MDQGVPLVIYPDAQAVVLVAASLTMRRVGAACHVAAAILLRCLEAIQKAVQGPCHERDPRMVRRDPLKSLVLPVRGLEYTCFARDMLDSLLSRVFSAAGTSGGVSVSLDSCGRT